MADVSFSELFARALAGDPCTVVGVGDGPDVLPEPLPVGEWRRPADKTDLAVLDLCDGVTIDVGCGPGRMAAALAERGHDVLAIDVVAEAVALAQGLGVAAARHSVFDVLPHEGRWTTALLADGNVGIGGDPAALLRRIRELLEPGGRVVVDIAPPGTGIESRWAQLRCGDDTSRPFRWSVVGVDAIEELAISAGLQLRDLRSVKDRWIAVLVPGPMPVLPGLADLAVDHHAEHVAGLLDRHTNGHGTPRNGHANGHSNGHTNGHVNGHANGQLNGQLNGHADDHSDGPGIAGRP